MKIFKDRQSAGKLLAKHLKQYVGVDNMVILGIPRGGIVVAAEIAKELKLPLDIIVTRKIGHPNQPELAVGAVDLDGEVIGNVGEVGGIVEKELGELRRRESLYRQGRTPLKLKGKTVILVDDGIATGATTLAAVNYLKRHEAKKIILAVPVASYEAAEKLGKQVDEAIILETPEYFQAVGQFYEYFLPVSDEEVIKYLNHGR